MWSRGVHVYGYRTEDWMELDRLITHELSKITVDKAVKEMREAAGPPGPKRGQMFYQMSGSSKAGTVQIPGMFVVSSDGKKFIEDLAERIDRLTVEKVEARLGRPVNAEEAASRKHVELRPGMFVLSPDGVKGIKDLVKRVSTLEEDRSALVSIVKGQAARVETLEKALERMERRITAVERKTGVRPRTLGELSDSNPV